MLLCQNGGTCNQNQKCICPPEFKGVLCQQPRCEAGKDCNAASSLRPTTASLLLCTLLALLLATLSPHWATKMTPSPKPRPGSVCVCVYVRVSGMGPPKLWTRWTQAAALAKTKKIMRTHSRKLVPVSFQNTHTNTHLTGLLQNRVCAQVQEGQTEKKEWPQRREMQVKGKKNHTNHCSLYSWAGAMCIKPKSIKENT